MYIIVFFQEYNDELSVCNLKHFVNNKTMEKCQATQFSLFIICQNNCNYQQHHC